MVLHMENGSVNTLERTLDVKIPIVYLFREADKRLKDLSKTIKRPGFRPGKVPLAQVTKEYGAEVRQEALSELLAYYFEQEVKKNNLSVAGLIRFDTVDSDDTHYCFKAVYETYPVVEFNNLSQLELEKPVAVLTEEDLDRTFLLMRKQASTFTPVHRAAREDDRLSIRFHGQINGESISQGEFEQAQLIIGEGRFHRDFETPLIGHSTGDVLNITVHFPDDYAAKKVAGKSVDFEISILGVEEREIPELDEAFIRSVGIKDGTLASFRTEVEKNLARELHFRHRSIWKDRVFEKLLSQSSFDVPTVLVSKEIDRMKENAINEFKERKSPVVMKKDQLPDSLFKDKATRYITLGLIVQNLVRQHNLTPTSAQLEQAVKLMSEAYEDSEAMIQWMKKQPEKMNEVGFFVAEENVVDWVMSQVKLTQVDVPFKELHQLLPQ
jgi:trigger factor